MGGSAAKSERRGGFARPIAVAIRGMSDGFGPDTHASRFDGGEHPDAPDVGGRPDREVRQGKGWVYRGGDSATDYPQNFRSRARY